MLVKFAVLVILGSLVAGEKVRYDNYSMHKVVPENEDQVNFLKELKNSMKGLDFWKISAQANDFASIVSPPHLREVLEHALQKRSIPSQVMIENLQEEFEKEHATIRRKRDTTLAGNLFWNGYQTADNIHAWFERQAQANPNVVTVINIGRSFEGRNLTGIKISRGTGRKAFFLEAGMVGADWLSPAVVTYVADQLIRRVDSRSADAANDFDWYIFPMTNPDGHEFSQESTRLWYKNRRQISSANVGVDLTKNWNSQWGVNGGSHDPSSNNYMGLGPFSEPETRHLSRFIESIGHDLVAFLSFRQFGQRLVVPFAHTNDLLYNFNEMVNIGRLSMGALSVKYGTQYLVGNSQQVHDGATGDIIDWVKYRFNPPVAAKYLLRDTGSSGYIININQVEPSCEETYDSIMAIIREAKYLNIV